MFLRSSPVAQCQLKTQLQAGIEIIIRVGHAGTVSSSFIQSITHQEGTSLSPLCGCHGDSNWNVAEVVTMFW